MSANPHFSPTHYCGRRSSGIFRAYSLLASQHSVNYAFATKSSVHPKSTAISAPSLRGQVKNAD